MLNNKPIIGLIAKHDKRDIIRQESTIRDEMKNVIFHNGGIPIGILCPRDEVRFAPRLSHITDEEMDEMLSENEKQLFIEELSMCDGVILSGGPETDDYEMWVARYCYQNDIPLLCICAGQNNLARALGGRVSKISNPENHARPNDTFVHYLNIDKNSKFYDIVKTERLYINSRHQRIVTDPANLDVVGRDDEGNIEVIEDKNKKFCMGTRYHPESLYKLDERENAIFKNFVEVCKKK